MKDYTYRIQAHKATRELRRLMYKHLVMLVKLEQPGAVIDEYEVAYSEAMSKIERFMDVASDPESPLPDAHYTDEENEIEIQKLKDAELEWKKIQRLIK